MQELIEKMENSNGWILLVINENKEKMYTVDCHSSKNLPNEVVDELIIDIAKLRKKSKSKQK